MAFDLGPVIRGAVDGNPEDDAPGLNLVERAQQSANPDKVPLEQSANLLLLRRAHELLGAGQLSREHFCTVVEQVLQVIEQLLQHLDEPEEGTDEAQEELADRASDQLENIASGLEEMMAGARASDQALLDAGLRRVEQGYAGLDATEDEAQAITEQFDDD